jgi:hypothetical protein
MSHLPQFNFPAFQQAADSLREKGYDVVSPAELDDPATRAASMASETGDPDDLPDQTWGDALARDVKLIADEVDGTALLPGWEDSRGARLEAFITRLCGKPVFYNVSYKLDAILWDDPAHAAVCHCRSLYHPESWAEVSAPGVVELDDEELDAVLTMGDLDVLRKIERDQEAQPLYRQEFTAEFLDGAQEDLDDMMSYNELLKGEERITSSTGGQKGRKPERLDLVPVEPLWELSRVYGFGASKYDDHNYLKGYDWSLSIGAMQRHVTQWMNGEDTDDESGLSHLAHAAWHCFALMMFQQHALGTDDRLVTVVEGLQSETTTRSGRSEEARKS